MIVDDHPLVRRGPKAVIDAEPDLIVCGEAATREDGLRAIAAVRPDLVVVELSLVRGDGLELNSRNPIPLLGSSGARADDARGASVCPARVRGRRQRLRHEE